MKIGDNDSTPILRVFLWCHGCDEEWEYRTPILEAQLVDRNTKLYTRCPHCNTRIKLLLSPGAARVLIL